MKGSKRAVNSQMPAAKVSLTGAKGTYDHNPNGPFGQPHDLGNGGIPVKFMDNMGETPASRITPTQTAPSSQGRPRPGTTQFGYGSQND